MLQMFLFVQKNKKETILKHFTVGKDLYVFTVSSKFLTLVWYQYQNSAYSSK